MSRPPLTELPASVVAHLDGGRLNVVATVDPDGRPATTLMSWVIARSSRSLALAVDTRSRAFENLCARPAMAVEILGDDLIFGVKGTARVAKTQMESTPFPCAIVELLIDEARDHGSPGTNFRGPSYHYDEDKQHRHGLEERVYAELRSLPEPTLARG
jgi:flavin reductase (DIM6/NTAB) family NADH-FMN oxidoreductase RutF